MKPEFIVADEPVSMIDVSLRTTIIDLMQDLRKELELTYLFITHDLAVAKYTSNKIAIMYLGKVIEMGGKERLFLNPLRHTHKLCSLRFLFQIQSKKKKDRAYRRSSIRNQHTSRL